MQSLVVVILLSSNITLFADTTWSDWFQQLWNGSDADQIKFKFQSEMDSDKLLVQNNPINAYRIADKWYDLGYSEIALEFDELFVEEDSAKASIVAKKWFGRGKKDIAFKFTQLYPVLAILVFNENLSRGNFAGAEEYGNKMLEYWVSQKDEDIQKNINHKLILAARMESVYYYNILKGKLKEIDQKDTFQNYLKYFENLPLNLNGKDISITDYLSHRAYINPDFLNEYEISIEEARMMLEIDLYELTKKNDIIFSILHCIALHAKEDPYFKLHVFSKNPLGENAIGEYFFSLKRANINLPLRSPLFGGILAHEWTHQLMDILFNNGAKPYGAYDMEAQIAYKKVMEEIWNKLDEAPNELKDFSKLDPSIDSYGRTITNFNDIKELYTEDKYDLEAIVRFPEAIAYGDYEDSKVKEFLKPLCDYWMQYIEPAINKYIKDHADNDTFISDWERESILNPFYGVEIESIEYKSDLKKVKEKSETGAYFISDKWYKRQEIDRAIELDLIHVNNNSFMASTIADKWYNRGQIIQALKFDLIYVDNIAFMADAIAGKWLQRGYPEIADIFKMLSEK